jgi:hypothetical protein
MWWGVDHKPPPPPHTPQSFASAHPTTVHPLCTRLGATSHHGCTVSRGCYRGAEKQTAREPPGEAGGRGRGRGRVSGGMGTPYIALLIEKAGPPRRQLLLFGAGTSGCQETPRRRRQGSGQTQGTASRGGGRHRHRPCGQHPCRDAPGGVLGREKGKGGREGEGWRGGGDKEKGGGWRRRLTSHSHTPGKCRHGIDGKMTGAIG